MFRVESEFFRHPDEEAPGQRLVRAGRARFVGHQRGVAPDWLAVQPPEAVERPARQLLARIPLALPEMHQSSRAVTVAQAVVKRRRQPLLVRAHRGGVPLGAVGVVDRNESRLAALGEAHVAGEQLGVDGASEAFDFRPLLLAVGLGDARRFPDARNLHL